MTDEPHEVLSLQLSKNMTKQEEWAKEVVAIGIDEVIRNQKQIEARAKDEITNIKKRIVEAEESSKNFEQVKHQQSEELSSLKSSIHEVKEHIEKSMKEKEILVKELEKLQAENEKNKQDVLMTKEQSERKMEAELEELNLLQQLLGMEIKKIPDETMRISFSQLSPSEPNKKCLFCVKLVQEGAVIKYKVTACQPPVSDLDALIQKLNETNNFRSFVITLRSRFKNMVSRR